MILDDIFEAGTESIKLSDKDIFIKIWTSPRLVFKYLNENSYGKFVALLLVLAGITRTFDRAISQGNGDDTPLPIIIIMSIFIGAILGWISLYIYSALISWVGKWLNGKSNTNSILRTLAHANIPAITTLVLLTIQIVILGDDIFKSSFNMNNYELPIVLFNYAVFFLETSLTLWTLVIFVIGISEIQGFSIWKSIINILLPGFLIVVPLVLIFYLWGVINR